MFIHSYLLIGAVITILGLLSVWRREGIDYINEYYFNSFVGILGVISVVVLWPIYVIGVYNDDFRDNKS